MQNLAVKYCPYITNLRNAMELSRFIENLMLEIFPGSYNVFSSI